MNPVKQIAALYVQRGGVYFGLDNVDPWDESRDARLYDGPHPVVAHPPCQRWGALGAAAFARWGGEHNRPGNDGGCFAHAVDCVRRFGGVLEHPAKSMAFEAFGIDKPRGMGWLRVSPSEWVCEVWQSAYGHRANKATWLYYVGKLSPPELKWERPSGTHQIGFHDRRGKTANKPTVSKHEASRTPIEFRDMLISMARSANESR